MLDIYERLGVVVMDENRRIGNESAYVDNMGAMVKRDRNHTSVAIWWLCNELILALTLTPTPALTLAVTRTRTPTLTNPKP